MDTENKELLDEVKAMLERMTEGEYALAATESRTIDEHLAWYRGVLERSVDQGEGLYMVITPEGRLVAVTGNGSHSRANAELFVLAPKLIRFLLEELVKFYQEAAQNAEQ